MEFHRKIRQKGKRVPKKLEKKSLRSKAMDFLSRVRRCILLPLSGILLVSFSGISCRAKESPSLHENSGIIAEVVSQLVKQPEDGSGKIISTAASKSNEEKRQALVNIATTQVGVREKPLGSNRGPEVDQYNLLGSGSLQDPWCASFTTWCFIKSSQRNFPHSPYCPDWFDKSKKVETPQSGDQALVYSSSLGRYFHIICCVTDVRYRGSRAIESVGIEGNTNDDGSAEGIGVFKRIRRCDSVTYVRWIR